MRMRVLLAAGALAVVPALAAAQQRPATPAARPQTAATGAAHREGSIELTAGLGAIIGDRLLFGRLHDWDISVMDGDATGRILPGAYLGVSYNLNEKLGFGLGTGLHFGRGATALSPYGLFTYTFDLNRKTSPFVTAGLGLTRYSGHSTRQTAQIGGYAGVGVRSMIAEKLALRLEGRFGYENWASPPNQASAFEEFPSSSMDARLVAGLSYFMGGGPPPDTDGDGVPDKRDRCASTPSGATVDLRGCPSDSDRDGVWTGLDRCPNTPANTPVDRNGCTLDTDNDGIADNLDRCANTPANARPLDANGCPVDTDSDGVADYLDRCASTPAGTPVDANGCPRDSDNDGVIDPNDRCSATPANARPVDASGCPTDADRDGVADYLDTCSNTAPNTQVDASGCPVARDADRDGVIDANDRCANTPSAARVDANGCTLMALPEVNAALVIRNITFRAGTARLLPSANAELDRLATAILATPGSRWEIAGHTDATGVAARNLRLSQQRAQAVVDYLLRRSVPENALTAVGYGQTRPVAPNRTAAGRAQNRRVEIKRLS